MRRIVPWLFLLLAIACQEPLSTEQFIPGGGPYVFTVDMSDSTAAYDFDLYTRLDGDPEDLIPVKGTKKPAPFSEILYPVLVHFIYSLLKLTDIAFILAKGNILRAIRHDFPR